MIDLTGKRAFVTGGGRGIGRATALLLARAGAKVAVGYRSRKPDPDALVAATIAGDLGDPAAARRAVGEVRRTFGGLDILVVNHGSSLARHITGEILNVNGGSVLCG